MCACRRCRSYTRRTCESQSRHSVSSSDILQLIFETEPRVYQLTSQVGQQAWGICSPLPLVLAPGLQTHTPVPTFLHESRGTELTLVWQALLTEPFPSPPFIIHMLSTTPTFPGTEGQQGHPSLETPGLISVTKCPLPAPGSSHCLLRIEEYSRLWYGVLASPV